MIRSKMLSCAAGSAGGVPVTQSLILRTGSSAKQYRMLDGVLLDPIATPNSTLATGDIYQNETQVSPNGLLYASGYYSLGVSPKVGTFSYATGFGTPSTVSISSMRSQQISWHPDSTTFVSTGGLGARLFKMNIDGTINSSAVISPASSIGGWNFNNAGNVIAYYSLNDAPTIRFYTYTPGATVIGTAFTNPATLPSSGWAMKPLWNTDDSFVFMGGKAYGWNNSTGFTGVVYSSGLEGTHGYCVGWLDDTTLVLSSSNEIKAIGFNTATGFTGVKATLTSTYTSDKNMLWVDPVLKYIYTSEYIINTYGTYKLYRTPYNSATGLFGTPVNILPTTGSNSVYRSYVYTHV